MKVSKFNQMKIYERPFKPNVLSYPCQYDEPVSKFRGVGGFFSFFPNFNRICCKQTMKILIRRCRLQRLIRISTVCICSIKRTLGDMG